MKRNLLVVLAAQAVFGTLSLLITSGVRRRAS